MPKIIKRTFLASALLALAVTTTAVFASGAYPTKPIKLVVPFPAGGTSDMVARMLGAGLGARLAQPVIVENRPGAGTALGTDVVAKSAPDGYTLLLTSPGVAINASMRKALPYNTEADLEETATLADLPMAIYASPQSNIKTIPDLVAAARAQPGGLAYGTAGEGSTGHLTMKLFESATSTKLSHIPFQGSAPSMNALLGGHIPLAVDTVYLGAPYVSSGKIVAIATLGKKRSSLLPSVPTAIEAGLPQFESTAWFGIAVRRGTPQPITEQLNQAIAAVMREPRVREALERDGFQVVGDSLAEAGMRFKNELSKMGAAVRAAEAPASPDSISR